MKRQRKKSDDLAKALATLDAAYSKQRATYRQFVESIQGQQPRAKANAWMVFAADNIDTYGDQEALVYLRSRGHECGKQIDELVSDWKRAAQQQIENCAKDVSVYVLETGETKREGGIPLAKVSDVKNVSPYLLHNFWGGRDEQGLSIDATMLRTVQWCEIGGFDEWWERLARTTTQDVIQGGIDSVPGSFWLFNMSRSDYAIELMGRALDRALEVIELPSNGEPYPWRVMREWNAQGERASCSVDHLPYAAAIVFANLRVRSSQPNDSLIRLATEVILKAQDEDGAWHCWADSHPSVEATAMCLHAVALWRPRGWERAGRKGVKWLWSKQERSGCWLDRGSPDPVYLSVLVLDALNLAEGRQEVTFGKQVGGQNLTVPAGNRRFKVALSFPGELRGRVEPIADALAQRLGKDKVFYDRFHEAELARPNLDVYLQAIYHDQSEIVAVFLCEDYIKKEWCGLEWRAVRDLIKKRRDQDLMLFRTDSSPVSGILSIDGYIDVTDRPCDELVQLILARLSMTKL